MEFIYKDKSYEVIIIKKNNKNTYVRVRDNKIYVTTNYFATNRSIDKLLKEHYSAIGRMIDRSIKREEKKELFLLFGKFYKIIYTDLVEKIELEDETIRVINEETLCKWLDQFIHTTFYNHLMHWYDNFEESIPIPTLKIRKMKTRWGVCNTRTKTITLNLELFRYDMECLDYVVIHELSHLLVPNHSRAFWSVVEKYCPNYKEIKKKLKN